jgi:cysteine sulfinate desulfinase/cysteine desulfurase-like protein
VTVPSGLVDGPIYLDYNATTPIDPAVTESMLPYLTAEFGNPSSTHHYGRESRVALDNARDQVAALLGTSAERIVFSGSDRSYPATTRSASRAREQQQYAGHHHQPDLRHPHP